MAKFVSQINRSGSGVRSGYTLPSGTTSYKISGRRIISKQGGSTTTIADTEKGTETTVTEQPAQAVPPPVPQPVRTVQPAARPTAASVRGKIGNFFSSNYNRLDASLGGVLPGGAPPSKFVEEKLTARSKSGGVSTFGSVAKSFFSGQVYVEKKLKEKFPKEYGTFERTPILGAKFETSKGVAFVEPFLKAQAFAPAFSTGAFKKTTKTTQAALSETRFSNKGIAKSTKAKGIIEKKLVSIKSTSKQLKFLRKIQLEAKSPAAKEGFRKLFQSVQEKGIVKINVKDILASSPRSSPITATRFTQPTQYTTPLKPAAREVARKIVFDIRAFSIPRNLKGAGALTGTTASLSRFSGLQEEKTSRRLGAMSLAIPVLKGTPIQGTVTKTKLASSTRSGQKLINVPKQATPTIPKQTTITIPKTVPRLRTPTRIFTKGTTKKPTRRFPKPFWLPTFNPRQSRMFSPTKPQRRKAPPRTPSLLAIGRGITSPTKGFLEGSSLTIRPIIVGRKKKRGKKKKR